MHKHDLLMHKRWFRLFSWFTLTAVMTMSVYFVEHNATVLRTSLIPTVTHKTFDGTVYPIQKTPNWAQLSSAEYDNSYSNIPSNKLVDTPYYNPNDFKTSFNDLTWGDSSTEDIRNAKITYSVPYMGDYSLDSVEYSGSHLAVDMKIPYGTPVFAMGNGVVEKVSNISTGFGHHIVIRHNNFPTIDNDGQFTTYYSSYSHLDTILIAEGQVVDKGDQIALSGDSGTATTPHLHFQIDNDNADWHPYWPFTWQDASDAGLSFFEAVNAGLGQSAAMSTTINPMMYVQKYLDPSASVVESASSVAVAEPEPVVEPEPEPVIEPEVVVEPEVEEEVYVPVTTTVVEEEPENVAFDVVSRSSYDEGDTAYMTVYADASSFDGLVNLSLNNEIGDLELTRLSDNDFKDGKIQLSIKNLEPGKAKLKVAYGQDVYYSDWFEVNEKVAETPTRFSFSDVPDTHPNNSAIEHLAVNAVIGGYPDGTFKPNNTVTRAEALKFVLEGINSGMEISTLPFKDVADSDWYYKYVSTALLRNIVGGYSDGSFRGSNPVTRAEFLKILFTAMDVNLPSKVKKDPYKDVDKDDWYAPYFQYADDHDIIDNNVRAWPELGMNRGDVAEAMYRVMVD
jgi:murein DD-endopeptidase MepM/ murein hydrolase activator NlpD